MPICSCVVLSDVQGKAKSRAQKRKQQQQQQQQAESAPVAPLSQSNVAALNTMTSGTSAGAPTTVSGFATAGQGTAGGGSLLDLDPLDPLGGTGPTQTVAAMQAKGELAILT